MNGPKLKRGARSENDPTRSAPGKLAEKARAVIHQRKKSKHSVVLVTGTTANQQGIEGCASLYDQNRYRV
jgi:hypothetical protein